jgi:hypothetical protein
VPESSGFLEKSQEKMKEKKSGYPHLLNRIDGCLDFFAQGVSIEDHATFGTGQ